MDYGQIRNNTQQPKQHAEPDYLNALGILPKYPNHSEAPKAGTKDPKAGTRVLLATLEQLQKDLRVLGEAVNELNNRLAPVSVPEPEETLGAPGRELPGCSPITIGLSQADEMVMRLTKQVANIVSRLEL